MDIDYDFSFDVALFTATACKYDTGTATEQQTATKKLAATATKKLEVLLRNNLYEEKYILGEYDNEIDDADVEWVASGVTGID